MTIKEKIIELLKNHPEDRFSIEALALELKVKQAKDFKEMVKTLAMLDGEGKLHFTDEGKIQATQAPKNQPKALVSGIFHANANGFGFVTIDAEEDDVFIAKGKTKFALDGDQVEIELTKNGNPLKAQSAEGHVVQILQHQIHQVVGLYHQFSKKEAKEKGGLGFVKSRNKKLPYHVLVSADSIKAEDKAVVRVEITQYPSAEFPETMRGAITEIVGQDSDAGIDVLEILASMDIRSEFPKDVIDEANRVPSEVLDSDVAGRVDYRNEITFTIDGADAKDLDDAVHAKRLENGNFELGVHIADVSHYVTEGSSLDREAYERATSVYVTDRVVPMLPERLSNGICSLNPRVNRLTQSCVMEITPQGKVVNYQISQSMIKTTERMTYDDVNLMIAKDPSALTKYAAIAESVEIMTELHGILEKMRQKRGAINFDTVEAKIIVDEKGLPVEIRKRTRGTAERMIESFMLAANETVASDFEKRQLPFIYRIHEHPKEDRLQRFIDFASTFGMKISGTAQHMTQTALQDFLNKAKGKPGEMVLSTMLLRSMQQAKYSENNAGHFGLAADNYTHFTSPIRRYPDLLVHRLIRVMAHPTSKDIEKWEERIPEMAQHTSNRERRAVDAEREVEKMKKAEFMSTHVDEEFDAIVASVTRFGMFVELDNTIEGLVHISTIKNDYMTYQERSLTLVGERSGKVFRIGQPIKVKLVRADKLTGDIDFEYLPSDFDVIEKAAKAKGKSRRRPKSDDKKDKQARPEKASSDKHKKPMDKKQKPLNPKKKNNHQKQTTDFNPKNKSKKPAGQAKSQAKGQAKKKTAHPYTIKTRG